MSRLTGVVVLIGAVLAWVVATVAVAESTDWPLWAILPLTLLFGALVGAVNFAIAANPQRSRAGVAGRVAVGVLVGVVVGELAAMALFSGAMPTTAQAQADARQAQTEQIAFDHAVEDARARRDQALVVARCEYNPSPACPQTQITGVPGRGPETRTANDILADTQRELDNAVAARDSHAADVASAEQALQHAREVNGSPGARWVAMHQHTLTGAAAMVLWAGTIAFFALLSVLPLILKLMRGESTRDRAEHDADTAIAVKRAEVRAAIENMWAEQQLASARLAVEAQHEIDRAAQHRRVAEALDVQPIRVELSREPEPVPEPVEEDMYLPIAAEAEAASFRPVENVPAKLDPRDDKQPLLHTAARWIRPLVPPIVARAIDTSTHPLRTARQVFEEVEEITFSLKRTHKVTIGSEETVEPQPGQSVSADSRNDRQRVESSRDSWYLPVDHEPRAELADWSGPGELRGRRNPRELPPSG